MELLYEHFGVERLAIVGGGHICGGFLEAGLIDEVSIMVAPGIDGRQGQTAVFDGISHTVQPLQAEIRKCGTMGNGYRVASLQSKIMKI